ncbi:hypothetical protein ACP4OV_014118 [Aristida adscensionis]
MTRRADLAGLARRVGYGWRADSVGMTRQADSAGSARRDDEMHGASHKRTDSCVDTICKRWILLILILHP